MANTTQQKKDAQGSIHGRREAPGADGVEPGLETTQRTNQPASGRPASPNQNRGGAQGEKTQKPGVRQNEK